MTPPRTVCQLLDGDTSLRLYKPQVRFLVSLRLATQRPSMFFSYLTIALTALSLVSAAPTPSEGTDLQKRAPVQIVRNCVNSGQVALTFDGEQAFPGRLSPLTSRRRHLPVRR